MGGRTHRHVWHRFHLRFVDQQKADAQLKDLGGAAIKQAAGSGALGSVGELGTSIVEMQDHVSGLQKNIDTLKKVQSALGGK